MSINDVDQSKQEESKEVEVKQPETLTAPAQQDIERSVMRDLLGVDDSELDQYHDKVNTLLEWAKTKTDDHSPESLRWTIRELGFNIGSPPLGQKLVNWLAEYAYLEMESQKVNKELEKYKHGK